jgi:hypothetical protein
MNKMAHFFAAAGMLSAKQNDELCQIYMMAKDCAECYFAGPEFVTRARNVKNAAEHAIRTQDPADYEHVYNIYGLIAGCMEPGYRTNSDEEEEE